MPKENLESFCLWGNAISKSCSRRCVSHFAMIISGVKLSNGWNREVLHIVKISWLLCKSYCPFEYERGSEEVVQKEGVPFISQSTQHFAKISKDITKIKQRYHKEIKKISQSTQQRHGVDLVYFWYHSPWILNIKVRSCVLYPCIIRRYPYAKGKYLVQMLVQQKGFTKLISMLSISLKGFFMFYKFRPSLQVEIICTH